MTELTWGIVLLTSIIGMGVILYRKTSALVSLPESFNSFPQASEIVDKIKEKSKEGVKKIPITGKIDHELYLQKILSKIRILTLKTENKTGLWLEKLRRKKNNHDKDDYWQELKKSKE